MTARNLNCFGQVSDDTKLASPSTLTKGKQKAGANRIYSGIYVQSPVILRPLHGEKTLARIHTLNEDWYPR